MPGMDKIKSVGAIHPVGFGVINLESHIWRYPARLDGAQVITDDVGFGILITD